MRISSTAIAEWGGAAAILVAAAVTFGCRPSSPVKAPAVNEAFEVAGIRVPPESLNVYIASHRGFTSRGGEMRCAYQPIGQEAMRVFVWAVCLELLPSEDAQELLRGSGMSLPVALQIETRGRQSYVVGIEVPSDGSGHGASIRRIFPMSLLSRVLPPTEAANARGRALANQLQAEAVERFGLPPEAAQTPPRKPEVIPDLEVIADRCYRSTESVLLGPATGRGQRGHPPGWIRLERMATRRATGPAALIDANGSALRAVWRRLRGDSILIHGADDFLRTELRIAVTADSVNGRGQAYSDAAAERDSSGRLGDLRREWALQGTAAPCDRMPRR